MSEKGKSGKKPAKIKLTYAQQISGLKNICELLRQEKQREVIPPIIFDSLSSITKFPVVTMEERSRESWAEAGMKSVVSIPLGDTHGSISFANPEEVDVDQSLREWLDAICFLLGNFLGYSRMAASSSPSAPMPEDETGKLHEKIVELETALRSQALFDDVTLLPNPSLFRLLMSHHIAYARRKNDLVAILQIELQKVDDLASGLGLSGINAIVKQAADRMMSGMRDGDIVVRNGDARFLWSLPGMRSIEDVARIAEKMLLALSRPMEVEGHQIILTGSIGISIFPNDGMDPDALIAGSEEALAFSRKVQANAYRFHGAGVNEKIRTRLTFRKELKEAASKQEFVLHYQPVVRVDSQEIEGAEALIRWKKNQGSTLYPAQFLDVAEEFGMAQNFDEWVIRSAWKQRNTWLKEGLGPLQMNVNLSAPLFWEGAARIARMLDEIKPEREFLELEIKESILKKDPEKAIEILEDLQKLGVRLCVDDFGTAGISPFQLKRFPVQTIKIDMSLVRGIIPQSGNAVIVAALISLANSMKIRVIAEGVETQTELDCLKFLGCEHYQGNFFSRAVPKAMFLDLRKTKKAAQSSAAPTTVHEDKTQPVIIPTEMRATLEREAAGELLNSVQKTASVQEENSAPSELKKEPEKIVIPTPQPLPQIPVHRPVEKIPPLIDFPKPRLQTPVPPPKTSSVAPYVIRCNHCGLEYNALEAVWCLCLTSDPSLICPHCHKCFCKDPLQHRHDIWGHAPEVFWERKRQHEMRMELLPPNPLPHAVRHPLVLVVDDEHLVLRTASRLIRSLGFAVVTASNGEEGFGVAKRYVPELVICDALMPRMDGREMCRLVKQDPKTKEAKIVLMTSFSGAGKYKGALMKDVQFDDQLQKPVEFERLRAVLHKLL